MEKQIADEASSVSCCWSIHLNQSLTFSPYLPMVFVSRHKIFNQRQFPVVVLGLHNFLLGYSHICHQLCNKVQQYKVVYGAKELWERLVTNSEAKEVALALSWMLPRVQKGTSLCLLGFGRGPAEMLLKYSQRSHQNF